MLFMWVLFGGEYHPLLCRTLLDTLHSFQTQGTRWFLIFAGAMLGITAALLWSAQGSIMMSYPLEKDKGKAFGIFWAIFQFGSFIGAVIALAINIRSGKLSAVSTSTYIVRPHSQYPVRRRTEEVQRALSLVVGVFVVDQGSVMHALVVAREGDLP